MALVTIRAAPDVVSHTGMLLGCPGLGVAVCAGEHRVVGGVGVTSAAHPSGPAVIGGEPGMVERSSRPAGCCVAGLARRGETCGCVIRICRSFVVRRVTGVAIRWRPGKHVVDMTARTRDIDVGASKRKRRFAVVKGCAGPRHGAVAYRAILGEAS